MFSHMNSVPSSLSKLEQILQGNQGYYGPVFAGCTSFKFETYNSKSADRSD